jgi:hypothetical protein
MKLKFLSSLAWPIQISTQALNAQVYPKIVDIYSEEILVIEIALGIHIYTLVLAVQYKKV